MTGSSKVTDLYLASAKVFKLKLFCDDTDLSKLGHFKWLSEEVVKQLQNNLKGILDNNPLSGSFFFLINGELCVETYQIITYSYKEPVDFNFLFNFSEEYSKQIKPTLKFLRRELDLDWYF